MSTQQETRWALAERLAALSDKLLQQANEAENADARSKLLVASAAMAEAADRAALVARMVTPATP